VAGKGADLSLFGEPPPEDTYETADFPLSELSLEERTLAALEAAGYHTFLDIIDLEKKDLLQVPGLTETDADQLLVIIDELTVVEGEGASEELSEAGVEVGPEGPDSEASEDSDEKSDEEEDQEEDEEEDEGKDGEEEPVSEPEEDGDEPTS